MFLAISVQLRFLSFAKYRLSLHFYTRVKMVDVRVCGTAFYEVASFRPIIFKLADHFNCVYIFVVNQIVKTYLNFGIRFVKNNLNYKCPNTYWQLLSHHLESSYHYLRSNAVKTSVNVSFFVRLLVFVFIYVRLCLFYGCDFVIVFIVPSSLEMRQFLFCR